MNKIVVVSLVANSADIIESFVRHSLTFADAMIILDHDSADATPVILQQLAAEGLPITVRSLARAELAHDAVMLSLVREAAERCGADIVLPLDADEFLVGSEDVRGILQQLAADRLYQVRLWQYELAEPEQEQTLFLLARACRRDKKPGSPKILLGGQVVRQASFQLAQGCHYAYRTVEEKRVSLPSVSLEEQLHLAHFQWRSGEQIRSKVIDGWISNAARYSVHTIRCAYWKSHFDTLLRGETLALAMDKNQVEPAELSAYAGEAVLRYTENMLLDAMKNLMVLSERLAEDYSEEKSLCARRQVSVLMLLDADFAAIQASLESVLAQTYPWIEVLLGDMAAVMSPEMKKFLENYRGKVPVRYLHARSGERSDLRKLLGQQAAGEYIQWLLPGDVLFPDKLRRMVASLENDDELTLVIADPENVSAIPDTDGLIGYMRMTGADQFLAYYGSYICSSLLSHSQLPAGGLSSALFRRRTMEASHWLADYELGGRFCEFLMWYYLLNPSLVGVFCEAELTRCWQVPTAEAGVYHQLTWFCLLQLLLKEPAMEAVCQRGLSALLAKRDIVRAQLGKLPAALVRQYEVAMAEAESLAAMFGKKDS